VAGFESEDGRFRPVPTNRVGCILKLRKAGLFQAARHERGVGESVHAVSAITASKPHHGGSRFENGDRVRSHFGDFIDGIQQRSESARGIPKAGIPK
jgi:hypothetical protein